MKLDEYEIQTLNEIKAEYELKMKVWAQMVMKRRNLTGSIAIHPDGTITPATLGTESLNGVSVG